MKKNRIFVMGMLALTFGLFSAQSVSSEEYYAKSAADRDEYFLDREWFAENYYAVVRSDDVPSERSNMPIIWEAAPLAGKKVIDGAIYIQNGWTMNIVFMTKARSVKGIQIRWFETKEEVEALKKMGADQKITVWGPFGGPATDAVIKQRHQKILDNIQAYINNPNSPPANWQ